MGYIGRGSSTQVLTDNATGTLPNFKAATTNLTFQTDSGTATPSAGTITFNANSNAGSSVLFTGTSSTVSLKVTDASNNTIIGSSAGNGTLSSSAGTALGFQALHASTIGNSNTAIGYQALKAVTGGNQNTALGASSLNGITTGVQNIAIGSTAANNYTGTESSNIIIGNTGTTGESNIIRIGVQGSGTGQQNTCFIAGIQGVAVTSKQYVTINTSTGQLGSEAAGTLFQTKNQVFTSSGTYTPTAGMVYCTIEAVGGGGGGGGTATSSASFYSGGGGGGGGGYARIIATAATIGASQTVTIGAAGTAGAAGNNAGGNGGDTSVGVICVGKGGTGGSGSPGSSSSNGGAGGVAGTGDLTFPGTAGGAALFSGITAATGFTGPGGNSYFGAGAPMQVANAANVTGAAGSLYGGGGSGGVSYNNGGTVAGGAGTKGIVIIQEYIIS